MVREERITADVTMLEMLSPPKLNLTWPISGLAFIETPEPEIKQYRAMYHAVGDNHFWVNRKRLTDGQLGALLYHPENYVTQLWKDNECIGFTEYHARHFPQMEIVFVGLLASETGKGLGRAMLSHTLQKIWNRNPTRVIIETNTLDHPSALPLYQKIGFKPYKRKRVSIKNSQ